MNSGRRSAGMPVPGFFPARCASVSTVPAGSGSLATRLLVKIARRGAISSATASLSTGLARIRSTKRIPSTSCSQLLHRDRRGDIRTEHPAAHRHVDLHDLDAKRGGGDSWIDRARVIRQPDRSSRTAHGRTGSCSARCAREDRVRRRALQDGQGQARAADAIDGLVHLDHVAHAARQQNRAAGRDHRVEQREIADFARRQPSTSPCRRASAGRPLRAKTVSSGR